MAETGGERAVTLNALIKKEEGLYIAHCLEMDIVATAASLKQVKKDIIDLIKAQIDYAFSYDNLEHLFHPAPKEVWEEFWACKKQEEERHRILSASKKPNTKGFIPPWIITNICKSLDPRHA